MEKPSKQNIVADVTDIMKIVPHRYPMLLIDAVLEYEVGVFAVAKKVFSYNEAFFQGHSPNNKPIVPGTILLESLAQTAVFAINPTISDEEALLLTGVNRLRFFKSVLPGDCIIHKVEITKNRHGLWNVNGKGTVDGQICIGAEFTFVKKKL